MIRLLPCLCGASSLIAFFTDAEIEYCELEMAWYRQRPDTACVLKFTDYVHDLESTMKAVYSRCLGREMPAEAPTSHPPRTRKRYLVNRDPEQLGIDVRAVNERLADYLAWVR